MDSRGIPGNELAPAMLDVSRALRVRTTPCVDLRTPRFVLGSLQRMQRSGMLAYPRQDALAGIVVFLVA
ncbi:MAG: hypothetical protein RLZ94_667, partial [Actinomycetota bacterium]